MGEAGPMIVAHDAYCPHCNYNLRGLKVCRCPECGSAFDAAELSSSLIPWTHRRKIGRVKAFIRTANLATFGPKRLLPMGAAELGRSEARRFRWMCEVLLAIPVCAALLSTDLKDLADALYQASIGRPLPVSGMAEQWSRQLAAMWDVAGGWWPFKLALGLAIAHFLVVVPVRLASFPKYSQSQRERVITAANYLSGSALGGAIVGIVAGGLWVGTLLASTHQPLPSLLDLVAPIGTTAAIFCAILWAVATARFFGQVRIISGISPAMVGLIAPVLVLLWAFAWLALLPVCAGLLITIVRML